MFTLGAIAKSEATKQSILELHVLVCFAFGSQRRFYLPVV
jgi:hypothetical protein